MKTAVYAGSFDPITNGHLDILKAGAQMFDKVVIAVAKNNSKKNLLTVEERIQLIKESTKDIPNVEVDSYEGLTVEYAKKHNAQILLRGLRTASDFEYEMQISQTNRKLAGDIKTVFLTANPEFSYVSSSVVREILANNGEVSNFVPQPVAKYLTKKFA